MKYHSVRMCTGVTWEYAGVKSGSLKMYGSFRVNTVSIMTVYGEANSVKISTVNIWLNDGAH